MKGGQQVEDLNGGIVELIPLEVKKKKKTSVSLLGVSRAKSTIVKVLTCVYHQQQQQQAAA